MSLTKSSTATTGCINSAARGKAEGAKGDLLSCMFSSGLLPDGELGLHINEGNQNVMMLSLPCQMMVICGKLCQEVFVFSCVCHQGVYCAEIFSGVLCSSDSTDGFNIIVDGSNCSPTMTSCE